jgi:hypothetical protein
MAARIPILFFTLCSTTFAWHAYRASTAGNPGNYWMIPCNDGYMHLGAYGPDGPTLQQGESVCAAHGGISVAPTGPGPIVYQIITGPPERLGISLGAIVDGGLVDANLATRLTNSREPAVWAGAKVGFTPLAGTAPPGAVTLTATPIDLPETQDYWIWTIAAAGMAFLVMVAILWRPERPGAEPSAASLSR